MKEGSQSNERLAGLSPESLLWVTSLFCGFLGAFLLIAPHRFQTPSYRALLPHALAWGTLALASGMGMLAVAVLRLRRWVSALAHFFVGLTLLALAVSFFRVGAVSGGLIYSLLGLGTFAAGLLPRGRRATPSGDLFGLLMGLSATLVGALMVGLPGLFRDSFFSARQFDLKSFGVALLVIGPPLAAAQLAPGIRRRWSWPIHILAGATFVIFGLLIALPRQSWTGVALYIGGGGAITCLPWLRGRLEALDTSSLRARLALTLAIATSLSLILATAVVTAQEEQLAREQVRAIQRVEARSVAQNVSDYVEMNGARTATLAAFAGREPMTSERQGVLLAASRAVYPDLRALRTVSLDGRLLAGAGTVAIPPDAVLDLARSVTREQRYQLSPVQTKRGPFFLLGAPIHDLAGDLAGTLVAAFATESLTGRIAQEGAQVSLADGLGHRIATVDRVPSSETLPPLPSEWDRRVRGGRPVRRAEGVAAFVLVPRLNWVVAVERPRATALAGVRRGRDLAFGLLLLVVPLAAAGGILAARRIARPLGDLSSAAGEMTAGNLAVPIGASSGITEVDGLSSAFQEMRDRLAERTLESERLAAELRARAEALAETDRRKDEFLAMLAHELRNPLGAIANSSYLLEQLGPTEPQVRPLAIIQRQIQHLVRMVDDLLDVSRITRGKVELRRQPIDLGEVLRHAAEAARPLVDAREQTLRLDLPAEPLSLDGDGTRLEQVFTNLLRNAVKFTDRQGHIELAARREGREAVVRVRDSGIGIAADLLPRVFDLFAQGEQGLDRSGAGLGIGLTLVRSLVEMHGGHVHARSEGAGKGSEFEVRLPPGPYQGTEEGPQYRPTSPTEKLRPRASGATSSGESR